MKAVQLVQPSGIDALEVVELGTPSVYPNQVLIAVEAATINPVDLSVATGALTARMPGSGPWTPGWDLAGTVTAVGSGVDATLIGSRVLGFSQWFQSGNGTQASEVVLPFENVAVADGALKAAELTTFGLNGLTALHALDATAVPEGGTVIVVGASGGVGGFVAELASSRGLTVVPVGRDTDRASLRDLGAHALVNAGPLDPTVLVGVRDGGRVTSVTGAFEPERGITAQRVGVSPDKAGLESLVDLAERGVLSVHLGATFPVEQVGDAYRAVADGSSHDRIVLTF